jgi:DNA adenine methylase
MSYLGAKSVSGAYQAIIAAMPPHDVYIETHLGSGAVMRAKPAAARSIGVDLDTRPIEAFCAPYAVELHAGDAVDFLQRFDFAAAGRVLIYADPPYVLSTRTSDKRYPHDYTDADHRRLIAALRGVPAAVILSGYPSALYDELLGDWRSFRFQAMTRGGPRTEQVWLNFPAGDVQWARFAGANFGERQRIKRKAARWAEHYRRLPAGERLAVLAAILGEHGAPGGIDARDDAAARPPATWSPASMAAGDHGQPRLWPIPAETPASMHDRAGADLE